MAISGLILAAPATTLGYLGSSDDSGFVLLGIIFGLPCLILGGVLWSGVTLPSYCRRLLKWPVLWRGSIHNYDGRGAVLPGLLLGAGAFIFSFSVADACAQVSWLHPVEWLLTAAGFAFAAFVAAYVLVYRLVNLPKWLRPKAHRCQVHRAREQNRAALISRYADPDVIEAFNCRGTLPPRRRADPAEDWLRGQGPLGQEAADGLQRERERDDEPPRQRDLDRF